MASNEAFKRQRHRRQIWEADQMREQQRLELERDLATARRALYRVIRTAESGAYYNVEDAVHCVQTDLGAIMDAVMRGSETTIALAGNRA